MGNEKLRIIATIVFSIILILISCLPNDEVTTAHNSLIVDNKAAFMKNRQANFDSLNNGQVVEAEKIANLIKEMWYENLNINVELEQVTFEEKIAREHSGNYFISRSSFVGDYVDKEAFLSLWRSWSDYNDLNWTNKKYDNLLKKSSKYKYKDERNQVLEEAEQILIEEMPIMPIYNYSHEIVKKPTLSNVYKPLHKHPLFIYAEITSS